MRQRLPHLPRELLLVAAAACVVGAVLLGAATVATVGASIWGLAIGIAVGVVVTLVARRLLRPGTPTAGLAAAGASGATLGDHPLPGDVPPPEMAGS